MLFILLCSSLVAVSEFSRYTCPELMSDCFDTTLSSFGVETFKNYFETPFLKMESVMWMYFTREKPNLCGISKEHFNFSGW